MTVRKDFSLAGLSSDVMFGKGGGRLVWNTDRFESTSDGTTLAQVRVPTTPVNNNDAASKIYVDSVASGVDAKNSVRVGTTAAGALATDYDNGKTVDGVVLATGDRILIKDQGSAIENGIYVVAAAGVPTRASDADGAGELSGGTYAFIEEGTVQGDTGWVISSNGSLTPGVDANVWVQFSSAGVLSAGTGMTKSGTVLNVNVGATSITVDGSDDLIVNSSATAGQILISGGAVGTEATFGALDLTNVNATTGVLIQSRGGLGSDVSAFSQNSIYVVGAGQTTTAVAIGTNGNSLRTVGGVPAWGQVDISDGINAISGILDETNGGTGNSTYIVGDLLIGTGVDTLGKITISGTANDVLTSNGTTASWAAPTPASGSVVTLVGTVTFGGGATQQIGAIDIPLGARVIKTSMSVDTLFDTAATVEIGFTGNQSVLMTITENDPQESVIFSTDNNYVFAAAQTVNAYLVAAGATTGSATVVISYIQP